MPVVRRAGRETGPVSAGARDRYVQLQWRPVADAVEASGFPKDDWADYRSVYMSRWTAALDERFVSDQIAATNQIRWECEYLADMDPDLVDTAKRFRLVYQGRAYDVVGATVVGRGRAIEFVTLASSSLGGA